MGRGRVLANTKVSDLISAASSGRIAVRTLRRADAMTILANAGAVVAATGNDELTVQGLAADRIAALLAAAQVPFSELRQHRASLEEAYMELTRDATDFHGAPISNAS